MYKIDISLDTYIKWKQIEKNLDIFCIIRNETFYSYVNGNNAHAYKNKKK